MWTLKKITVILSYRIMADNIPCDHAPRGTTATLLYYGNTPAKKDRFVQIGVIIPGTFGVDAFYAELHLELDHLQAFIDAAKKQSSQRVKEPYQ